VLAFFRVFLMRCYRHRLLSEFRHFMRTTHGSFWPYKLACCRARRAAIRKADALRQGGALSGQGRKRQRGGLGEDEESSEVPLSLEKEEPGKVLFPGPSSTVTGRSSATLLSSARTRQKLSAAPESRAASKSHSSSSRTRTHLGAADTSSVRTRKHVSAASFLTRPSAIGSSSART
jgi:hypothetical protein